ncbi:MAG: type II toxin-antitoxin system VapC family toxin [Jiangellaceae bacterium]
MITYVDSSVLVRAFLSDEDGHDEAERLLDEPGLAFVTGTWTRIEVAGALVRAGHAGRGQVHDLLAALTARIDATEGSVAVLSAPQDKIEVGVLELVLEYGMRAMDAWHLACAGYLLPGVSESGEPTAFATRDGQQREAALRLGFAAV